MKKRVLIGGAWPYANNSLHVGHLAALLPGDIIARYSRAAGYEVIYVSGTDSHGTPITERSKREKVSAASIAERYHGEFTRDFGDMLFSYDKYGATFDDYHKDHVKEIFKKIADGGYLYEKSEGQDYCPVCDQFLSDRELEGRCPVCGKLTRGDQCEHCMASFDSGELTEKHCRACHSETELRENKHLIFALSKFQKDVEEFCAANAQNWRLNAVNETKKYLSQGLPDRAATRNLDWGVEVPFEGYEDKRIYVWFEAVLGYITMARSVCESRGIDFDAFMKADGGLRAYYIHGKDNIPFHTVIFPALEMAMDREMQLPTHIISSEYVNMNDEKMSKSKGNLITVHQLAEDYPADAVRFYTMLFNPERRDINYSLDDLVTTYNKFLAGGFGNFVNRNLSFLKKKFDSVVPNGNVDPEVREYVKGLYVSMGEKIEAGELRSATEDIVSLIQYANKYYDDQKPWIQVKEDEKAFADTTATCIYLMANMSNLFAPVLVNGCKALKKTLFLDETPVWEEIDVKRDLVLGDIEIMYGRIDAK